MRRCRDAFEVAPGRRRQAPSARQRVSVARDGDLGRHGQHQPLHFLALATPIFTYFDAYA